MDSQSDSGKNGSPVVLVTGAGAGLGFALVQEFLQQNFRVCAGVRDLERARKEYGSLVENPSLRLVALDVQDPRHVDDCKKSILSREGRLDLLINNAGIGIYGAFEEIPEQEYRHIMETNFFGVLRVTRAFLPLFREQGSGRIINVSSILGRLSLPAASPYSATKWALEAFSESLRQEVWPFGVSVLLVEPGVIRTSFKQNTRFTGEQANPRSPYQFLNRLMTRDYSFHHTPVQVAARRIVRLAKSRNPALRHLVGLDARLAWTARQFLPPRVMEWAVRWKLGRSLKKTVQN